MASIAGDKVSSIFGLVLPQLFPDFQLQTRILKLRGLRVFWIVIIYISVKMIHQTEPPIFLGVVFA